MTRRSTPLALSLALALPLMALPPAAEAGSWFTSTTNRSLRADAANPHPGDEYQGQTYVTPGGCSYSRAQAPGYKPTWHLIHNGASAGLTNAHRGCPAMLGDYERL
ncbi:hypothetical protein KUV62_12095 [Salipiger bermudensis]|uniref:hypothetical protein n=1 Tax=Salipiger bermudensis TaxID=344736 RepID=UPI001C9A211C|nr:hypothetical protein [Salipiger bermudensis]MBY6004655.1 hypothetical protein [Salipiger bermudensis]